MPRPDGPEDWRETIRQLQLRIAALEDDNEALAEGHEDALLLGIVSEQIQKGQGGEILRLGLERVAVLKDVPFCACLRLQDQQAVFLQHYCSVTDAPPGVDRLMLSPSVAERLAHDSLLLTGEACATAGLDAPIVASFVPAAALLVPFTSHALPSGVFLFVDDRGDQRLRRGFNMLHRVCDALIARMDNDALLRELRQLNADLDAKVRARTADLEARNQELLRESAERMRAEEELRQSQRLESIGQLAGGVAHDFNNLLTTILGTVDLLRDEVPADDPIQDDLLVIQEAGNRAAELTGQLLAFSRRQRLEKRVVSLGQLCHDFSRMLRRVIPEHVDVRISSVPGTALVSVDVGRIEQVLLNLAVNASDAMPDGGRLEIRVMPGADGHEVVMEVADEGVGIPPELTQRIFEPFFTTKPAGRGTGLGLATVYGIVKQHGGHIGVQSTVDHGSVFRVTLPATTLPAAADTPTSRDVPPVQGSETVLVVDDDETVRQVVRQGLARLGYAPVAMGPIEALAALKDGTGPGRGFDALVTDVIMPGASGADVAHAFAARFPDSAVVFMSGYPGERVRLPEDALLLEKPVSAVEVAGAVRRALRRAGRA